MFLKRLNKAKTVPGKAKLLLESMKVKLLQKKIFLSGLGFKRILNHAVKFGCSGNIKKWTASRERSRNGKTYRVFYGRTVYYGH